MAPGLSKVIVPVSASPFAETLIAAMRGAAPMCNGRIGRTRSTILPSSDALRVAISDVPNGVRIRTLPENIGLASITNPFSVLRAVSDAPPGSKHKRIGGRGAGQLRMTQLTTGVGTPSPTLPSFHVKNGGSTPSARSSKLDGQSNEKPSEQSSYNTRE